MDFKVKGENKKLIFGVRFVSEMDESEKITQHGMEFGVGLMMAQEKLNSGQGLYTTLAKILKFALIKENFTEDEIMEALDEYGEENDLEVFISKIEDELKNSNAVRTAKARANKMIKEANRKKPLEAAK